MKQNYFKKILLGLSLSIAATASAVEKPKYPVQTLTDGGTYVMCNLAQPEGYMCRTSWDNAMYFLGKSSYAEWGVQVTAHYDAEKALWYFVTTATEHAAVEADEENGVDAQDAYTEYTYMGIPSGTDNIRSRETTQCYWIVKDGITKGFYTLTPGEGNNEATLGYALHLNAGGTYAVCNEPTNSWYPDFYGGIKYEDDGETPVEIYDEEKDVTLKIMADSTSMNWGFVLEEDLDKYNFLGTAWKELNNYETTTCATEGFEEGFLASLKAAVAIFQGDTFGDEEYAAMKAILQAKSDFYDQITKAYEMQGEDDGVDNAIEQAEKDFAALTSADEVNAACATLKKVCDDYAMGLGDITSMGKNMSFEDLSSQGGSQTSGVAIAPNGWNVYVNGTQLVEKSDYSQHFNAWHGINNDCEGYKDGEYGFGVWNSAIPEYELSQTITGLDNGTYTITAGLMVGSNGNGSRRTTQRLFGNYNSTLFASEEEYAEGILPLEYKDYANLEEPYTDRVMQMMSVRAYVYDGTLTFGVRTSGDLAAALRTNGNGSGGDGWFKVDNFTISKDGFDAEDQENLLTYFEETVNELLKEPMNNEFKESVSDVDKSDADKAIPTLAGLIMDIQEQVNAYATLATAITTAYERAESCDEQGYKGTTVFVDYIDGVNEKYIDGDYTMEEIDGVINDLNEAYQTCLRSGVDEGADVSELIVNRSFEDLSAQGGNNTNGVANAPAGWTLKINGVVCETAADIQAQGVVAWCGINGGDNINVEENGITYNHQYTDGTHVWGIWNSTIPQVELSQTITGLEPGTYVLTADVMARKTDWSGDNLTTQRIFAQDVVCMYGAENDYIPEYLQGTTSDDVYQAYAKTYIDGTYLDEENGYEYFNYANHDASHNDILLRTLELHFGVGEDGTATIGFRTDNIDPWSEEAAPKSNTAAGWFKLDNFTLYFESAQIPTRIQSACATESKAQKGMFDLSGRKVSKAQKGIYIINGQKVVK